MSATGRPILLRLLSRREGRTVLLPGLAALMLPTLAGAATAQTEVIDAGDPYVQRQTGFAFPARTGGAVRHQVIRYDADGADTGVGYQVTRGGRMVAYLSIFVYPAPSATTASGRTAACAGLFAGIERDVTSHEPDARLIAETQIQAPTPVFRAGGTSASFTGGSARFDGRDQPVRERADLFCHAGGRWLVAYRVTSPAAVDATPEIEALMHALPWPAALSRDPATDQSPQH